MVAAAVIPGPGRLAVRVDDSKRLTPVEREHAYQSIVASATVGVGILSAEEIDRLNILEATLRAMQDAVAALPDPPDRVLVDGPVAPRLAVPCDAVVRGDQCYYAISCASIVAKVIRDHLMGFYHRLYPQYAFATHKGYGTAFHAARLAQHGPSILHRRTFRPVAEAFVVEPLASAAGTVR